MDAERIESAVRELLLAIGEDPDRPGLSRTPERVAASYAEIFAGVGEDPTSVLSTAFAENHDELVLLREIEMYSVCEHHLLPFHGAVSVGYIPGTHGQVVGLSDVVRVVQLLSARPQLQERLTSQIADTLVESISPRGVVVVMECTHLCMSMRGVRAHTAGAVTSAVRGIFKRSAASRAEALSLMHTPGKR